MKIPFELPTNRMHLLCLCIESCFSSIVHNLLRVLMKPFLFKNGACKPFMTKKCETNIKEHGVNFCITYSTSISLLLDQVLLYWLLFWNMSARAKRAAFVKGPLPHYHSISDSSAGLKNTNQEICESQSQNHQFSLKI